MVWRRSSFDQTWGEAEMPRPKQEVAGFAVRFKSSAVTLEYSGWTASPGHASACSKKV